MITVEIDRILPTESDLRFGLVIRYGEGGAVRFAQARLSDDSLDWETMQRLAAWIARQVNQHLDREAALEDEIEQMPLF